MNSSDVDNKYMYEPVWITVPMKFSTESFPWFEFDFQICGYFEWERRYKRGIRETINGLRRQTSALHRQTAQSNQEW